MRWLLLFAAVGLVGAGCDKTVYRSHDAQYCSSTEDDDPYYECSRSSDLICINTYSKTYAQPNNQPDKVVAMWLCHEACDPTVKNPCVDPEEVCCPGAIFGKDYGKKNACVLREFCDALLGMPTTKDAGSSDAKPDAGGTADGPSSDLAADAGAPDADAASDAPSDL
jgi:hypothetical protein